MSVGMNIAIDPRLAHFTPRQVRIATKSITLMNNMMRGEKGATTNPSAAIPPVDQAKRIIDNGVGIGCLIDLQA